MTSGIQGKVALVTGASKGIGKAVSLMLAEEGARLALCARGDEELKLAAEEIRIHTRADVLALNANLLRQNDITRFVNAAVKKFSRIDILVNNAGAGHVGGILSTTDEEWEYHLQLKLFGYIRMAREVIPYMKANGGGKIINIAGTDWRDPQPLSLASGVANAALVNFTKSLSKELRSDHITVNAVNPGTTDTPLTKERYAKMAAVLQKSAEELRASHEQVSPEGRFATPEDVAKAVLFLASDLSNRVNGATLDVDAGQSPGL